MCMFIYDIHYSKKIIKIFFIIALNNFDRVYYNIYFLMNYI